MTDLTAKTAQTAVNLPNVKMWNGQRVVTFKDIDEVHERPAGTAKKNFGRNRKHFTVDEDFYLITRDDAIGTNCPIGNIPPKGITVLTESGYLMIVKSFTDDLSWEVQRRLVNGYFRCKELQSPAQSALPRHATVPAPRLKGWYHENQHRFNRIRTGALCDEKYIFHKILGRLKKIYDIEEMNRIYEREQGHEPFYATDIIPYFPEVEEVVDGWLDELVEIADTMAAERKSMRS